MLKKSVLLTLLTALSISIASIVSHHAIASDVEQTWTIILVRHGEKSTTPANDPNLSSQGLLRAKNLINEVNTHIGEQPLEKVYSTLYQRTQQTAAPTAQAFNLSVSAYPANDLANFAKRLINNKQTALVVGHSNTTVKLAELLTQQSISAIDDKTEFDRLIVIKFKQKHLLVSHQLTEFRYGVTQ